MSRDPTPWYDLAFGPWYSMIYAHRSPEAARREVTFLWKRHPWDVEHPVLDLACGPGRHLKPLAACGSPVVGADRSPSLVSQAAHLLPGGVVRADMRDLPFAGGAFGAVFSFFTSFGYFETEMEDQQVLKEVARVLASGGLHVLDYLLAERVAAELQPQTVRRAGDHRIYESRRLEDRRVCKQVRVTDREGREVTAYEESVRLYRSRELQDLLRSAGLEPLQTYGGFDGSTPESGGRLVIVARKAR